MTFRNHITDALVSLHWLRVPERITYKVAVMTYRALTGDVPSLTCLLATDSGPLLPTTCSTDLDRLSRFSGNRSPHLEHATTARHLCLIVDCI